MKLKSFLSLFAAVCFITSCSNDLAEDITSNEMPKENELQLLFSSSVDGEVYPTRAIATEEENAIKDLTIYVFGATSESESSSSYYYIDKWTSSTTQDNEKQQFVLQSSGVNKKASIFPKNVPNAKYLKLYCVANSKVITSDNSTSEFSTTPQTSLSGTTLSTFENYYTEKVNTNPIKTPLAMTGFGNAVHVSGNYGIVPVELKRRVARFDIDNNSSRTKLTIKSILIENASASAYLYNGSNNSIRYTSSKMKYPEVNYTQLKNANLGLTTSAMYVNPTKGDNSLMLVINGLYAGKNEVTYRLRVARTESGQKDPKNIDIKPNHRYTLRIAEVTSSEIVGYFEVEDWVDGGSVDVKPNYDVKPEMLEVKAVDSSDPFTGLAQGQSWTQADSTIRVAKDGKFTVKLKAPADCSNTTIQYITNDFVTRATTNNWLSVASSPVTAEEDGMRITTFTFTVNASVTNNAAPAKVSFINNAASVDPKYVLSYRVLPPSTLQHTTNITAASNSDYTDNSSNGTIVNTKGSEKLTLNLGKKFYVNVCSPYKPVLPTSTLAASSLEITQVKEDATTQTTTYCFNLKTLPADVDSKNDYKVTFTTAFEPSKTEKAERVEPEVPVENKTKVEYTLELKSTEVEVNAAAPSGGSYTNSDGSTLTVSNPKAPTGTIVNKLNNKLYIAFEKDVNVENSESENITVSLATNIPAARTGEQKVYEIKIAKIYTDTPLPSVSVTGETQKLKDVTIKFKNKIDTRKVTTLTLTVNKETPAVEPGQP